MKVDDVSKYSVVGHQGVVAHAPENSVEPFLLAERAGADEIELDVRCTSDDDDVFSVDLDTKPTVLAVAS